MRKIMSFFDFLMDVIVALPFLIAMLAAVIGAFVLLYMIQPVFFVVIVGCLVMGAVIELFSKFVN